MVPSLLFPSVQINQSNRSINQSGFEPRFCFKQTTRSCAASGSNNKEIVPFPYTQSRQKPRSHNASNINS